MPWPTVTRYVLQEEKKNIKFLNIYTAAYQIQISNLFPSSAMGELVLQHSVFFFMRTIILSFSAAQKGQFSQKRLEKNTRKIWSCSPRLQLLFRLCPSSHSCATLVVPGQYDSSSIWMVYSNSSFVSQEKANAYPLRLNELILIT